jgi:hypothetical protein
MKDHGRSSPTTLERGVGASSESVLMDSGWLAREVEAELSRKKRSVCIQLVEK